MRQLHKHFLDGVKRFSRKGKVKSTDWNDFAGHITYHQGDFKDPATYSNLETKCAQLDQEWKVKAGHIFHLATPPVMFGVIPKMLADAGLNRNRSRDRIVVEKPIGHDLDSAREMNRTLTESFHESQIFRIDHYLGKETVQNILAFRFANPLFEPIWNRRYVDYVTITVAEEVGVGHRGGYYEHAGALRDMVQNHLMQLLCLVAMEPMVSFNADEIRNKKVDVLHAIRPIRRGAPSGMRSCGGSTAGASFTARRCAATARKTSVSPHSQTETFAALKLFIDNWRWQGVPFYLRTGKRLPGRFRKSPSNFAPCRIGPFRPSPATIGTRPGWSCRSSPRKASCWAFRPNTPGRRCCCGRWRCGSITRRAFAVPSPDAYETLLWDVMNNDPTLFMRADQVEAAWQILMPVLEAWASTPRTVFPITPPAVGAPRQPTSCSPAMDTNGGQSRDDLGDRHRRHACEAAGDRSQAAG